jgi:poly(A) polymerase
MGINYEAAVPRLARESFFSYGWYMNDMLKQLPPGLISITRHLSQDFKSARIYLVGGAVRDIILKRATKDYDLVVGGLAIKHLEGWLADHGKVSLVGRNFGVFKWQPAGWDGDVIDIALPRTEHVELGTGQYRDFNIQSNSELPIEEDLRRRDFTINALALDLVTGQLIDPTNGQSDLKKRLIRAVGEADKRLNEDLSRTLRGLRQACQLEFEIETDTLKAITKAATKTANGKLNNEWLVPREVIARELLKALAADPVRVIELLDVTGFLKELLPEVSAMKGVPQPPQFHSEGDVFEHTKLALAATKSAGWKKFFALARPDFNTLVAILLHDIGKPLTIKTPETDGTDRIRTDNHDVVGAALVGAICSRLKLTSYNDALLGLIEPEKISWLVAKHMILVHGQPEEFKPHTIYRYFWKDYQLGLSLQQLLFADSYATKPQDGRDLTTSLTRLQKRLDEVGTRLDNNKQLKLLLSGDEIMKAFKLPPGPKIGQLLKLLEEAQLEKTISTKTQAKSYLRSKLKD